MNVMKMRTLSVLGLSFLMTGCASIIMDASQTIKVETYTKSGKEVQGADCSLGNDASMASVKSGSITMMHRSQKDMKIKCSAPSLPDAEANVISRINVGMAGNILVGGPFGAGIDLLTGKGYNYPIWLRLVFGELRTYDKFESVESEVQLGKLVSEVTASSSPAAQPEQRQAGMAPSVPAPASTSVDKQATRLSDPSVLPYVGSRAKQGYAEWLTKPYPRAFALSERGYWAGAWGDDPEDAAQAKDPSQRALAVCSKNAAAPCKLYAVDDAVVWQGKKAMN